VARRGARGGDVELIGELDSFDEAASAAAAADRRVRAALVLASRATFDDATLVDGTRVLALTTSVRSPSSSAASAVAAAAAAAAADLGLAGTSALTLALLDAAAAAAPAPAAGATAALSEPREERAVFDDAGRRDERELPLRAEEEESVERILPRHDAEAGDATSTGTTKPSSSARSRTTGSCRIAVVSGLRAQFRRRSKSTSWQSLTLYPVTLSKRPVTMR
jgi:hypothetical protein